MKYRETEGLKKRTETGERETGRDGQTETVM